MRKKRTQSLSSLGLQVVMATVLQEVRVHRKKCQACGRQGRLQGEAVLSKLNLELTWFPGRQGGGGGGGLGYGRHCR